MAGTPEMSSKHRGVPIMIQTEERRKLSSDPKKSSHFEAYSDEDSGTLMPRICRYPATTNHLTEGKRPPTNAVGLGKDRCPGSNRR